MYNKNIYVARKAEVYDAIVVGSGISGGWAAKELTEKGLKTLVLERGRAITHGSDYITEHKRPWELPNRGGAADVATKEQSFVHSRDTGVFNETTKHWYPNDHEHPYIEEKPFTWIRGYHEGGRSIMWGRQCYRWSDLDFEANLNDGNGVDWPIRYKDIAPWYDYVESYVGISGERLGLSHLPDGQFQPGMELNVVEKHLRDHIETTFTDRTLTIARVAILTEALNGRAACHYCGPCRRGCSTASYFSSVSTTLPAARATGNMTLRHHSIAHSLIFDEDKGLVTGVRVIDEQTLEQFEFRANVIFLCASALGSTQIMLNSTSNRFPNGMANSSGALGHYLMDHHFRIGAHGVHAGFEDRYYYGNRPTGFYIPRFRNISSATRRSYVRGYGYQGGASRMGWSRGNQERGFGVTLKRSLRDAGPWRASMTAFGETLPRYQNHVKLDPDQKDKWGIPLLRIRCEWGENEFAMRKDMGNDAADMLEAAGFQDINRYDNFKEGGVGGAEPGLGIHEMGTARMGRDPKTSVLNAHNQAHEVPNLFVTDGACMTSSGCQNPSITYMALTARAAAFAVEELKKGNLT